DGATVPGLRLAAGGKKIEPLRRASGGGDERSARRPVRSLRGPRRPLRLVAMRGGMTTAPSATSEAREARSRPSTAIAALLAWLVPGLGHWYLGCRDRAVIILVTIVVTFWGGVALGGVRSTFNVQENGPWLAAQLCTGPQALVGLMWAKSLPRPNTAPGVVPFADRLQAA